ncbi:glycosyltransferase, partial [Candidatus Fermentibacteria bacterium]|nr:glycosyltransferase [Candidatus Fermentibacteria bacterium]
MPAELSVVITTYNSAPFIGSALSSLAALSPSEAPAAVTVVDNCSSDGTTEAAASFGGVRVIR